MGAQAGVTKTRKKMVPSTANHTSKNPRSTQNAQGPRTTRVQAYCNSKHPTSNPHPTDSSTHTYDSQRFSVRTLRIGQCSAAARSLRPVGSVVLPPVQMTPYDRAQNAQRLSCCSTGLRWRWRKTTRLRTGAVQVAQVPQGINHWVPAWNTLQSSLRSVVRSRRTHAGRDSIQALHSTLSYWFKYTRSPPETLITSRPLPNKAF